MSRSLKYDFAGPDFRVAAEDLSRPGHRQAVRARSRAAAAAHGGSGLRTRRAAARSRRRRAAGGLPRRRVLAQARAQARAAPRAHAAAQPATGLRDRRGRRRRPPARGLRARLLDQLPGSLAEEAPPPPAPDPAAPSCGSSPAVSSRGARCTWRPTTRATPRRSRRCWRPSRCSRTCTRPPPGVPSPRRAVATAYELEWRAQGRDCRYFWHRRVSDSALA